MVDAQLVVVEKTFVLCCVVSYEGSSHFRPYCIVKNDISTATPGQAGLPAEFKHINKRRKRNLQGFP